MDDVSSLLGSKSKTIVHCVYQYDHKYWGSSDSNPIADPNPRLERLINDARRGARIRRQLDSYFDTAVDRCSNQATADNVHAIAAAEKLDIEVRLVNPAGGGLHAKLFLIRVGDERWSAVGSLNGGETSHKLNREVMLLVDAPEVNERLSEVFMHDWVVEMR